MAQWMIGEAYLRERNPEAALAEFLRVEVLHPWPEWQAAGLLQAAKCYAVLHRLRPAAETLSRLVEKYPKSRFAAEASRQLQDIRSDPEYEIASQSDEQRTQ